MQLRESRHVPYCEFPQPLFENFFHEYKGHLNPSLRLPPGSCGRTPLGSRTICLLQRSETFEDVIPLRLQLRAEVDGLAVEELADLS